MRDSNVRPERSGTMAADARPAIPGNEASSTTGAVPEPYRSCTAEPYRNRTGAMTGAQSSSAGSTQAVARLIEDAVIETQPFAATI